MEDARRGHTKDSTHGNETNRSRQSFASRFTNLPSVHEINFPTPDRMNVIT